MGVRNYLIEGVSGTGKTTVAAVLQRRCYHVIDGDRELAYRGYPEWGQKHWLWDINKVKSLTPITAAQSLFSAAALEIFPALLICLMGFLFLRSTILTYCFGGLMSAWRGTLPTGAENPKKKNLLNDCTQQKKIPLRVS